MYHSTVTALRGIPVGARPRPRFARPDEPLIGEALVARGALDPGDLARALALRAREDVRLGEILLAHGMVAESELYAALADRWNASLVDLAAEPPDFRLIDLIGAETCLRHRILPWRRVGGATVIVTARPEEFRARVDELPPRARPALMAIAPEADILDTIVALRSRSLVRRAETLAPEERSCRSWDGQRFQRYLLAVLAILAACALAAPVATFAALTVLALAVMTANMGLRGAATLALGRAGGDRAAPPAARPAPARLPVVSILVPLFHETGIADRLVQRLSRLSYPRELLDICLVTEDSDETTRVTLAATRLPRGFRVVTVPEGTLRTKPRALNYALGFCRGSIIGIYDAEDRPDPDQIHRVVARFHERGPEVACLQGILDYYNATTNWMSRCFALEYAAWFRLVLPGIERLGFVVPLGGTTLFLRRAALEAVGGWDAHNVTEDADLGIRLARHGLRTELIDTVTHEEANCRVWPWVRQRSRWIKGYAMTWAVHMRAPRLLWRELGPRRFMGVQLLFGGSLLQHFLAPVLWSYWLLLFGLPHPMEGRLSGGPVLAMSALLVLSCLTNLAVYVLATRGTPHRRLLRWAPTTDAYFVLATVAGLKALAELILKPFYWDKTAHGIDMAEPQPEPAPAPPVDFAPLPATYRPRRAPTIS